MTHQAGDTAERDVVLIGAGGHAHVVADMLAAVEAIEGVSKAKVKKFKRELAKLRGRGESFA